MIPPNGWSAGSLGTVIASIDAGYSPLNENRPAIGNEQGVLRTSSIVAGVFDPRQNKVVLADYQKLRVPVKANTTILGRKNSDEIVGASAFVANDYPNLYLSDLLWELRVASETDPLWLSYVLQLGSTREHLRLSATGTQSSMKNLNRSVFLKIPILVPPPPEQRKIAEVLRTWDDAIERSEALVRAETRAFGALRRRLFVFGHEVPLSQVSTRIQRKSDGAPHTVMAISAKTGFVAQADKYRRDMAGASLANYTQLRRGEFAYNKGNSLTYPQGCIYALKADSALVPNVYYSFALCPDLNSGYYEHFFASGALNRQLARRITSGVRGNGLLNLNADDFFGVKVPVPDRAIQDAAADALNTGARRIELLQHKAELLRTQKRGLMQKLLTGRLRVNAAAEIESGRPDDD
jgi:hypothetical protein